MTKIPSAASALSTNRSTCRAGAKDAGNYITKLPKAEHTAQEWQHAREALMLVATHGGPTMLARIGVMQALNPHVVREDRKPKREALG